MVFAVAYLEGRAGRVEVAQFQAECFGQPQAFSASSESRKRSRRCSHAARIATICPGSKVAGARRGTCSFTGLTGIGRPLVT